MSEYCEYIEYIYRCCRKESNTAVSTCPSPSSASTPLNLAASTSPLLLMISPEKLCLAPLQNKNQPIAKHWPLVLERRSEDDVVLLVLVAGLVALSSKIWIW